MDLLFDAHCDVALSMVDLGADIGGRSRTTHFDLARARAGGLGAQVFAIFVEPDKFTGKAAWRRARTMIAAVESAVARCQDRVGFASHAGTPPDTVAGLGKLRAAGKIAALLGLEGAHGLGAADEPTVLGRLRWLARRRVRYLGLTWNNSNAVAGAAMDEGGGLTRLGRKVVLECARLGVLVDVSHASDATARQVLAMARVPVVASHSNARALCDVPRNLPDDLLRALGSRGGVVCVNFLPGFLDADVYATVERRRREAEEQAKRRFARPATDARRRALAERRFALDALRGVKKVPLERVVDHVEHMVRVAGPHAVGVGSDFDGTLLVPRGLEDVAAYPRLVRALGRRFPPPVVRGILGENLLRVFRDAEAAAAVR